MDVEKEMLITVSCKPPVDAFQTVGISKRNGIKIRGLILDIMKPKRDTYYNKRKYKVAVRKH
jgi:hypothetical protein